MGQTQTHFLPPWVPSTEVEKASEADYRKAILQISHSASNFVTLHEDPEFCFDWAEFRPFAEVAYRTDKQLFKILPRLVPRRVSEEEFWRNYFSHVFAVKQQFERAAASGTSAAPAASDSEPVAARSTSSCNPSISYPEKFHLAVHYASEGPPLPNLSDADRILLQALHQQASIGQCNKPRPGMWDTAEEKAKYEAWKKLGNMSCQEAMHLYVQAIEVFNENWMEWDGLRIGVPAAMNGSATAQTAAARRTAIDAMREFRLRIADVPVGDLELVREECELLRVALDARGGGS